MISVGGQQSAGFVEWAISKVCGEQASDSHCGFTVASITVVVYDWGAQDDAYREDHQCILFFSTDIRTRGRSTWSPARAVVSLEMILLYELESHIHRLDHASNGDRGNTGPLWVSYTSVYPCNEAICWPQNILDALHMNAVHRACSPG